jgi:hypothetical protein
MPHLAKPVIRRPPVLRHLRAGNPRDQLPRQSQRLQPNRVVVSCATFRFEPPRVRRFFLSPLYCSATRGARNLVVPSHHTWLNSEDR